jgi:2-C-methyl-D-erythritol 2,4-cyclodiphosphate synthase
MRIGHGYDVHKLVDGDGITIGGIFIPYDKTLLAHSDGDVLIHAIADALLGACGERDIGFQFPDNYSKYKNIDSKILLKRVLDIVKSKDYEIESIDCTIIAQAPKMSPYIEQMRGALSTVLEIPYDIINVKATTEEHLGFTGRKEGISAHCVCLLK